MPDIIKPKRATKSVADKSDKVLEKDELLLISPNTGSGTGRYGVKIGDGATATKDLPYAIDGEKADEMIVSEFTKESNENPVLSPGDKIKTLCGKLLKKFTYIETLLGKKVNTSDIYDGTDSSSTTKVATANSVRQVNEKADNNTNQLNQLNSNLATAIYSTDLMSAYDNPTFVRWDKNTANTPYKAGLTMNQVGFAFCHGRYSGWQTIVAFSEGSKETFFHYCISGVPSNWLTIFSISENTLADALHTGNNAGIYKVDSSTLNNPSITYGMEIILKDANSQWIFTIIIPTNLSAIYFNFYNGYGGSLGWIGWRKCDLVGVS